VDAAVAGGMAISNAPRTRNMSWRITNECEEPVCLQSVCDRGLGTIFAEQSDEGFATGGEAVENAPTGP
jgi:hypothetical protein